MSRSVVFGLVGLLTVFIVVLFALPYLKKYFPGAVQGFESGEEDFEGDDEHEGFENSDEDFEDDEDKNN